MNREVKSELLWIMTGWFCLVAISIGSKVGYGVSILILLFIAVEVLQRMDFRKQLRALGSSSCPSCGNGYSFASAKKARRDYFKECHEEGKRRSGVKIDYARFWKVRCEKCGAEAKFYYETRQVGS